MSGEGGGSVGVASIGIFLVRLSHPVISAGGNIMPPQGIEER